MICAQTNILVDLRGQKPRDLEVIKSTIPNIRLCSTPCHFGGVRYWLVCPRCEKRCAILYRTHLCRCCSTGHYETGSRPDRALDKSRRLRRKLGQNDPNVTLPIPVKPKRMRWHTYLRIRAELVDVHKTIRRLMLG